MNCPPIHACTICSDTYSSIHPTSDPSIYLLFILRPIPYYNTIPSIHNMLQSSPTTQIEYIYLCPDMNIKCKQCEFLCSIFWSNGFQQNGNNGSAKCRLLYGERGRYRHQCELRHHHRTVVSAWGEKGDAISARLRMTSAEFFCYI